MMKLKTKFLWGDPVVYQEAPKRKVNPNAWVDYINEGREPKQEKPADSFIEDMKRWIRWGKSH